MSERLQISVLGELQVLTNGETVSLPPSRKTRALIAYLAILARPQRRDHLCEMFWDFPTIPEPRFAGASARSDPSSITRAASVSRPTGTR